MRERDYTNITLNWTVPDGEKTLVWTKAGYPVLVSTMYDKYRFRYDTLVFKWDETLDKVFDYDEYDLAEFETAEEAKVGHEEMVAKWQEVDTDFRIIEHLRRK